MNVQNVSSSTGSGFVVSQPTMSPHMAPPESPVPTTPVQVSSTPPHPSPSPHMASSPAPPSLVGTQQAPSPNIQFSQPVSSVQGVVSQSPTVIQTMAPQGGLQFSSQVLQQGQINPATYIQPLYQGQQQMLLSSAGGLAIQSPLNQGITVMQGTSPKIQPANDVKQGGGNIQINNKASPQVVTTQGNTGKMQMVTSKGQTGQIVTGPSQTQFMTQQGPNGQTLVISPLNVLPQSGLVQAHQTLQPQTPVSSKTSQPKYIGAQKGTQPIHLAGGITGSQYRHINPGATQQLLSAGGQQVLGQTQIIGPLQTFNAFGPGLSWTGQLQGNPIIQSPILIRNQHDGSVYIQSAPGTPQQQQLQQVQVPQLQNTPQLGQQVSTVQSVQGVLPGVVHGVGPGTIVGTPPMSQSTTNLHIATPQTSLQSTQNQQTSHGGQSQVTAAGQLAQGLQSPVQNGSTRVQTPSTPQQTNIKIAGTSVPRVVRNISVRSDAPMGSVIPNTQTNTASVDVKDGENNEEAARKTQSAEITLQAQNIVEPQIIQLPPVATVPPLESPQPVSSVPVVSLPDLPEMDGSVSPALAEPFPQEGGEEPEMEEASEILTHIIHGYVIREGPKPFPVGRSALLTEMLRDEHEALFGSKERKRKSDSSKNESTSLKSSFENEETVTSNDEEAEDDKIASNSSSNNPTEQNNSNSEVPTKSNLLIPISSKPESHRRPSQWNVQEVYDFIQSVPGCAQYAEEFLAQEIDGEALLFLKRENLMSQMNIKLGPAAKICMRLNQLDIDKTQN